MLMRDLSAIADFVVVSIGLDQRFYKYSRNIYIKSLVQTSSRHSARYSSAVALGPTELLPR